MRAKAWLTEGLKITEKIIDGIPIKVHADRPRSLREILSKAVGASPGKIALIYQDQRIAYCDFCRRTDRVTTALQKLCGVQKGDRVARTSIASKWKTRYIPIPRCWRRPWWESRTKFSVSR